MFFPFPFKKFWVPIEKNAIKIYIFFSLNYLDPFIDYWIELFILESNLVQFKLKLI